MATREEVFEAINSERDYQDSLWWDYLADAAHKPNPLEIGEFLTLIAVYLRKAQDVWTVEKKTELEALNTVRKIAGIAVNCMEQHGAPRREGF
jgi:hypothetical protein